MFHNLIKIQSLFASDYVAHMRDITKLGAIKDRILIRLYVSSTIGTFSRNVLIELVITCILLSHWKTKFDTYISKTSYSYNLLYIVFFFNMCNVQQTAYV